MQITVTYNPHTYEKFFAPVFARFPQLEQSLVDDFIHYKATGQLPHYFGRDTLYDRPEDIKDAQLWHLHLEIGANKFPLPTYPNGKNFASSDQATLQWYRTSDSCLVYTQNLINENAYSLIAVFHPWAHSEAQNYKQIRALATVAREFRESIL